LLYDVAEAGPELRAAYKDKSIRKPKVGSGKDTVNRDVDVGSDTNGASTVKKVRRIRKV